MTARSDAQAQFELAVGAEFGCAVSPPVAFGDASPAECVQAVRRALGGDLTPARLAGVGDDELRALAQAFAQWFETQAPGVAELKSALDRIVFR